MHLPATGSARGSAFNNSFRENTVMPPFAIFVEITIEHLYYATAPSAISSTRTRQNCLNAAGSRVFRRARSASASSPSGRTPRRITARLISCTSSQSPGKAALPCACRGRRAKTASRKCADFSGRSKSFRNKFL